MLRPNEPAGIEVLAAMGHPQSVIASSVGCAPTTVAKHLRKPDVLAKVAGQRRCLIEEMLKKVSSVAGEALDTIVSLARNSEDDKVRLAAASKIFDIAIKLTEHASLVKQAEGLANTAQLVECKGKQVEISSMTEEERTKLIRETASQQR